MDEYKPNNSLNNRVFFFYSFVHRNISMRILECPPSDEAGYIDEADQFYRNPTLWLSEKYGLSSGHQDQLQFPTHIVLYNVLLPVS